LLEDKPELMIILAAPAMGVPVTHLVCVLYGMVRGCHQRFGSRSKTQVQDYPIIGGAVQL